MGDTFMSNKSIEELEEMKTVHESLMLLLNTVNEHSEGFKSVQETFDNLGKYIATSHTIFAQKLDLLTEKLEDQEKRIKNLERIVEAVESDAQGA
jgi:septation ring formation regulator EzrA